MKQKRKDLNQKPIINNMFEARLHEKLVTLRYTTRVEKMTFKPRCTTCNPRVSTRVIQLLWSHVMPCSCCHFKLSLRMKQQCICSCSGF